MIEVDVIAGPGDWARIGDVAALAERAVAAALSVIPEAPALPLEIGVLLSDDAGVRELNRSWRGIDKPTNVLSFPGPAAGSPDGLRHLGDVALAFDTVAREAAEEGKTLVDHLSHLIVHATLHLVGYDHESGDEEAEAMEALEVAALARLGIANPHRDMAA